MTQEFNVAVLTGGTSGLGRFVARGLVRAGWRLVLLARDPGRAEALLHWLKTEAPDAIIEIEPADLSLLEAARTAGRAIAARHRSIGLLVLNAGTFQARRRVTSEGHELVLAVNHLSPFVLMQSMTEPLLHGAARVVAVSSSTSDRARIDPDNLELARGWNLVRAYAQSKLAVMTTSFEWARRLGPQVTVNVVHPGTVATSLIRVGGPIGWVWRAMGNFVLTPEQGAATPLRAALDPTLAGVTGQYLKPAGVVLPNRRATDAALAARVWRATERLVAMPPASQ